MHSLIEACPLLIGCCVIFVRSARHWPLFKFSLTSARGPAESNTNTLTLDVTCTCRLSATQQECKRTFLLHAHLPFWKQPEGFSLFVFVFFMLLIKQNPRSPGKWPCIGRYSEAWAQLIPYLRNEGQKHLKKKCSFLLACCNPLSCTDTAATALSLFLIGKVTHN